VIYNVKNFKSGDKNGGASIYCAACSPGYTPIYKNGFIDTCTKINNCNLDNV